MILACIDIGSNTTRLLVADASNGRLRELASQRAFTRLGKSLGRYGTIPEEKIEETADAVGIQAGTARELGAESLVTVATAAIRDAANRSDLAAAVEGAAGTPLRVLSGDEEARLSFVGATRTLAAPLEGPVAVVDVGGGSSEIAIGDPDGSVSWVESFDIGSGSLADEHLRSDPPTVGELEALRAHLDRSFAVLAPPAAREGVAVGGSAGSLRRVVGAELSHETLERGIRILAQAPIGEIADRFELDPERVRLLPAGILVFEAVSDRLGLPLRIARGGLREGVLFELLDGAIPAEPEPPRR